MSRYSKRQIALIAELLADKLICTYQDEQIPAMVDGFASAGFTRAALQSACVGYLARPFRFLTGKIRAGYYLSNSDGWSK